MVTKKPKGLGRGLEALLGPKVEDKVEQAQAAEAGLPSSLPLSELCLLYTSPSPRDS